METVKNVAAILGVILSLASVCTLCSKHAKEAIARVFKKYGNDSGLQEVKEAIKAMDDKLESHIEEEAKQQAKACRQRIVRFADELYKGNKPDKEYTEDVLDDIDNYNQYCADHPKFPNSKAMCAISNIRKYYDNLTGIS